MNRLEVQNDWQKSIFIVLKQSSKISQVAGLRDFEGECSLSPFNSLEAGVWTITASFSKFNTRPASCLNHNLYPASTEIGDAIQD